MNPDIDWLVGDVVTNVTYDDQTQQWHLALSGDVRLSIECQWQIIAKGHVALASGDHGQRYGLPAPIDAVAGAMDLLAGRAIGRVLVDQASADLRIEFAGAVEIRTFNDSSGYEGWNLGAPRRGPKGMLYVAQGGGNIEVFGAK